MPDISAQNAAIYASGDIDEKWRSRCIQDRNVFNGTWEVMPKRSDPTDPILERLGISAFKRSLIRKVTPKTTFTMDENKKIYHFVSQLPLGIKKVADVPIDGSEFSQFDGDAEGEWNCSGLLTEGRLLQKRLLFDKTKEKVVLEMYDCRCVFESDPEGKESGPVQLFKWSLVDHRTTPATTVMADRWMKKLK